MSSRFLTFTEVLAVTGVGRDVIYRMMKKGEFPLSRKIGTQRVGWLESEVDEWANNRPVVQLNGSSKR